MLSYVTWHAYAMRLATLLALVNKIKLASCNPQLTPQTANQIKRLQFVNVMTLEPLNTSCNTYEGRERAEGGNNTTRP